jgi:hypothetical protein
MNPMIHYKDEQGVTVCGSTEEHRQFTLDSKKATCPRCRLIVNNRDRDLYLKDVETPGNVILIPQGWCNAFRNVDEDTGEVETYGYMGIHIEPNGPVDTLWVTFSHLERCEEITEAQARQIHPALFDHLQAINDNG